MDPRDQTFMTIHNLTLDANILFASESIFDILGYQPDEVQGQSCFDYFHPDEVPFARSVHSRGVLLDKAAVLHYARILSKDGRWVSCECCFTIVHDVLVASTSIYLRGEKSERRALEAPQIRRIFSCSPRDPRYHMLEHLSPKFKMPPMEREPRAALILNRFTRNLSIMFATNAVSTILGLQPEEIKDKSFYECIQENCLQDAIQCLESAKANESIAYLRFSFRDPRTDERDVDQYQLSGDEDEEEDNDDEEGEGNNTDAELHDRMDMDEDETQIQIKRESDFMAEDVKAAPPPNLHLPSPSGKIPPFPYPPRTHIRRTHSTTHLSGPTPRTASGLPPREPRGNGRREPPMSFELEAVVSCTSDGLVVVLRKARPPIPAPHPPLVPTPNFENGLFAAPWGQRPIHPYFPPDLLYTFRPPLLPQYMPLRENVKAAGGPPLDQLMRSIRDVAVFAWALVGINGNLATHARGLPKGVSQPAESMTPRDSATGSKARYLSPENLAHPTYASANTAPQYYSQGGQPLGPDAYSNPSAWPSPTSLFNVRGCEQGQLQYQHRPPNQFFQSPTQHHRHYHNYHHQNFREQQQLPEQQPPFLSGQRPVVDDLAQELLAETSSSQAYSRLSHPIPSTQTSRQDYSNHSFRHMWQ